MPSRGEYQDIKKLIEPYQTRLLALLEKMGGTAYNEWTIECNQIISKEIPERPERERCQLWHLLVGGGYESGTYFDFEGDISVENLILKKEAEYEQGKS